MGELIECGDFNAHNVLWDCTHTNCSRTIGKDIAKTALALANTGAHTFLRGATYSSALDLTLHSPSVPIMWKPAPDTEGSNHLPIEVRVKVGAKTTTRPVRVTDWNAFRAAMRKTTGNSVEAIAISLQTATKALHVPPFRPDPDVRIRALMVDRRRSQRRYRRTRLAEDEQQLNTASGRLRGYSKRLALRRWHNY